MYSYVYRRKGEQLPNAASERWSNQAFARIVKQSQCVRLLLHICWFLRHHASSIRLPNWPQILATREKSSKIMTRSLDAIKVTVNFGRHGTTYTSQLFVIMRYDALSLTWSHSVFFGLRCAKFNQGLTLQIQIHSQPYLKTCWLLSVTWFDKWSCAATSVWGLVATQEMGVRGLRRQEPRQWKGVKIAAGDYLGVYW